MTVQLPRLEQWERGWRVYCPRCSWNSKDLPFPNPDDALHVLTLHAVVCKGPIRATHVPHQPIPLPPAP